MKRDDVLDILRTNREVLEGIGVRSLALFGSVARGEGRVDSDIDLLVEFDRPTGFFGLIRLQHFLEELLGCRVDVSTSASLKPRVRAKVLAEAIRVA